MSPPCSGLASFLTHPLCIPFLELHLAFGDAWPSCSEWNDWARHQGAFQQHAKDLQFVSELRPGSRRRRREKKLAQVGLRSYEARIIERAEIPTRPQHPHDFFNALVWLRYPASKRCLHKLAYSLQKASAGGQRSPAADGLTCFDEGGVFYRCTADDDPQRLRALLRSRDDSAKQSLCRNFRQQFRVFGHGLLEGLFVRQLFQLQVSCLVLPFAGPAADWDRELANCLENEALSGDCWGTIPFGILWSP